MPSDSKFHQLLLDQIRSEFTASQQYTAVAVYLDGETSPGWPRTSTRRRSRSATTR
jgi:ferritin